MGISGPRKDRILGGIVNFAWGFRLNMTMDEIFSTHTF